MATREELLSHTVDLEPVARPTLDDLHSQNLVKRWRSCLATPSGKLVFYESPHRLHSEHTGHRMVTCLENLGPCSHLPSR